MVKIFYQASTIHLTSINLDIYLEKDTIISYIPQEIHKKFFNLNYSPPQRLKGIRKHKVFNSKILIL